MTQSQYLLGAGILFWIALVVLFAGVSFAMSAPSQAILVVTMIVAALLIFTTYLLAMKGMDRFGRHGFRSTEQR